MTAPTLSARGIRIQLGGCVILDDAAIEVRAGEVVGLLGPNGAGKTTLLRVCAGLLTPQAGDIGIGGMPLAALDRRARARRLAFLPSNAPCHWPLEVRRLVALGRIPHLSPWQRPTATDEAAVTRALIAAQATDFAERTVDTLSDGERARVMLARALAVEPDWLLADEPVAGLDPRHQLAVMGLLRRLAAEGHGIVVTLHDLALAVRFCDRAVLLDRGRLAGEGPPAEVLAPEALARVFGIRALAGQDGGEPFLIPWAETRP